MTNEKGETFFVGKDVAKALGHDQSDKAIQRHVDEDDRMKRTVTDNIGRGQRMFVINESGLYSLILSSQLAQAKAFKLESVQPYKPYKPYKRTNRTSEKKDTRGFAIFIYLPINIISKYNIIYSRRISLGKQLYDLYGCTDFISRHSRACSGKRCQKSR